MAPIAQNMPARAALKACSLCEGHARSMRINTASLARPLVVAPALAAACVLRAAAAWAGRGLSSPFPCTSSGGSCWSAEVSTEPTSGSGASVRPRPAAKRFTLALSDRCAPGRPPGLGGAVPGICWSALRMGGL